jgi:hypothetical protein
MKIKKSQFKQILQEEYQKMLFEQGDPPKTELSGDPAEAKHWIAPEELEYWWRGTTPGIGPREPIPGKWEPDPEQLELYPLRGYVSGRHIDEPVDIKDYPRQKTEDEMTPEEIALLTKLDIPYQRAPEGEVEMGRRTKLEKPKRPPVTDIFKTQVFTSSSSGMETSQGHYDLGGYMEEIGNAMGIPGDFPDLYYKNKNTIKDVYGKIFDPNNAIGLEPDGTLIVKESRALQKRFIRAMTGDDWRTTKDFVLPYYVKSRGDGRSGTQRKYSKKTAITFMTVEQAKDASKRAGYHPDYPNLQSNVHQWTAREERQLRKYIRNKVLNWRQGRLGTTGWCNFDGELFTCDELKKGGAPGFTEP